MWVVFALALCVFAFSIFYLTRHYWHESYYDSLEEDDADSEFDSKENEMDVVIWHYPRCSKSRQTLELLEDRGIEPTIRKYREDPPDAETLDEILQMLEMEPRDLMRKKEDPYEELGLDDESLSRSDLIEAMVDHPILIQRPVVLADGRAALGRPPESVLELFE